MSLKEEVVHAIFPNMSGVTKETVERLKKLGSKYPQYIPFANIIESVAIEMERMEKSGVIFQSKKNPEEIPSNRVEVSPKDVIKALEFPDTDPSQLNVFTEDVAEYFNMELGASLADCVELQGLRILIPDLPEELKPAARNIPLTRRNTYNTVIKSLIRAHHETVGAVRNLNEYQRKHIANATNESVELIQIAFRKRKTTK